MSFIRHHNRAALTVLALAGTMIMMQEASAENMGAAATSAASAGAAGAAAAADAARKAGSAASGAGRGAAEIGRRGAEGPSAVRGGGGIDVDALVNEEIIKATKEQQKKAQKIKMLEKEATLARQRTTQRRNEWSKDDVGRTRTESALLLLEYERALQREQEINLSLSHLKR